MYYCTEDSLTCDSFSEVEICFGQFVLGLFFSFANSFAISFFILTLFFSIFIVIFLILALLFLFFVTILVIEVLFLFAYIFFLSSFSWLLFTACFGFFNFVGVFLG